MFLNLGTHQQETDDFKKKPNFIFLYYYLHIYEKFYKFKYITPDRLEEALKLTPEQFINDPEKDIYQLFLVFIKKIIYKKVREYKGYKWTTILGYIIDNEFPLNHPLVPEKGLYNILKSTPDDRMEILKVLCELQIRDHKNIRKFTKEKFDKYKISYLDLMEIYCVGNDSNENKYYYTMGPILYKIDTNNEITIFKNSMEGIENFVESLHKKSNLRLNMNRILEDIKKYEKKKKEYFKKYLKKKINNEKQSDEIYIIEDYDNKNILPETKNIKIEKCPNNVNEDKIPETKYFKTERYLRKRSTYIPDDEENVNLEILAKHCEQNNSIITLDNLFSRLKKVFQKKSCYDSNDTIATKEIINNIKKEPESIKTKDTQNIKESQNNNNKKRKFEYMINEDLDNNNNINNNNNNNTNNNNNNKAYNDDDDNKTYDDDDNNHTIDYSIIKPIISNISYNMAQFYKFIEYSKTGH